MPADEESPPVLAGPDEGSIRLMGLDRTDLAVFEEVALAQQPAVPYLVHEDPLGRRQLGEPSTLVVELAFGLLAARTAAAYLLKRRHRVKFRHVIDVTTPQGEKRHEVIEWSDATSTEPDPASLTALATLLGMTTAELHELESTRDNGD